MGAYIYALKSPSRNVEIRVGNGEVMIAAISKYAYKPTSDGAWGRPGKIERMCELQVAAADSRWSGKHLPRVMIQIGMADKVEVGHSIYACYVSSYCDTPGPEYVGFVKEVREVKVGCRKELLIVADIVHPENIPDAHRYDND